MSHIMTVFLVEADCLEDAKSNVQSYIEDIHDWWDYGEVAEQSKKYNRPLSKCLAYIPHPDFIPLAAAAIKEAEDALKKKNYRLAGYKYRMAGILYENLLSYDYPIWNITLEDYSIPEDTRGWYAIEVDLHF